MPLIRRGNAKGLRLNGNHPAARGAQFLAVANGAGNMVDIITGQQGTPSGTVVQQSDGMLGNVVNLNTATTTDIEFAGRSVTPYSEITVAALVKFGASLGGVAQQSIISDNVPGTSGFCLNLNASNQPGLLCNAAGAVLGTAAVAGGYYFIAGTRSVNASGAVQYRDILARRMDDLSTLQVASAAVTFTGPLTPSGTITIGRKSATAYHHGDVAFAFMSTKALSDPALRAWSRDPWSIFSRGEDGRVFSSWVTSATFKPGWAYGATKSIGAVF